jgi:hypothetical protein
LVQLVAWANWPNESFEVWKWFDIRSGKEKTTDLNRIFQEIYSRIVPNRDFESLKKAGFRISSADGPMRAAEQEGRPPEEIVHFAWYRGHCLDEGKLSYFVSEEVIVQGAVRVDEIQEPRAYVIRTPANKSRDPKAVGSDIEREL